MALRLVRISARLPWMLLAAVCVLAIVRRAVSLVQVFAFGADYPANLYTEAISLAIAALLALSLALLAPPLAAMHDGQESARRAHQSQQNLLHREHRLLEQQAALLRLAMTPELFSNAHLSALEELAATASRCLEVERVSVWLYNHDRSAIQCALLYERGKGKSAGATTLYAKDYPRYFAALAQARAIATDDAESDPRTSEFRDSYLRPLGITSMLDAPIRADGRVIGILCHEHVGRPRVWSTEEQGFAGSLADLAALMFSAQERRRAEEERRGVERKLLETQRLEGMGLIAGGVAHDFNNLLTVILGSATLALADLEPDSPLRASLANVESAARKAAQLSRQLLAYSGKGPVVVEHLDWNEVVREMADLLQVTLSKKMRLSLDLAPALPAVSCDASQIRQVVMNLVLNAAESIGDREGSVLLRTAAMDLDPQEAAALTLPAPPGRYAVLSVLDTGPGLAPEVLPRIFDPFYSTKGIGRGLGLAAVAGIARAHRGGVRVRNRSGGGAEFSVFLPAAPVAAPPRPGKPAAPAPGRGELILVADDEEKLLHLAADILRRAGYRVLTAADGREAVAVFRRVGSEIQLVVLDLTMPGVSGGDVFLEIQRLAPDTRILVSSGYTEQSASHLFASRGFAGFVQKPYNAEELVRAVGLALPAAART
ncbi:MAG: hybrid sensor histidine kinase/response regulator [Planctomycetota bacterium]|nr:MAG: hybrid sensor histidine kinase/response regulator [Planctomycetota bacterium]